MLPSPHFQTDVIYVSLNLELRRKHGDYGTPDSAFTNAVPGRHSFYPIVAVLAEVYPLFVPAKKATLTSSQIHLCSKSVGQGPASRLSMRSEFSKKTAYLFLGFYELL